MLDPRDFSRAGRSELQARDRPAQNLNRQARRRAQSFESGIVAGGAGSGVDRQPENDDTGDSAEEQPPDDEPPFQGIAGWVFDETGEGVPELEVSAEARRLFALDGDSESQMTGTVSARSGAGGFFFIPGLADGEYAVRTEVTDRFESASGLFRAGSDSVVLIVAEKSDQRTLLRGFVESANGGSLEGVQVMAVGRFEDRVTTDRRGGYALPMAVDPQRRAQIVRYTLEDYREHRLTLDDSELRTQPEVVRNVVLQPECEGATVTGLVVGEDGTPVHRAHIQLFSARLGRRFDGASDRDGIFSIAEVELADDYRLWVRPPSGYKDHLEEGLVVTGWVDLRIELESAERTRLEGQMVDPAGRPVPGYTLWLRTSNTSDQPLNPVSGDELGRFEVDGLPVGSAALQTQASPHLSFSGIELASGRSTNVRLRLDVGIDRISGFILEPGGGGVPGATVDLLWSASENGLRSRSMRGTTTDANGYFLFTNLGSAPHTLTVTARGFLGARIVVPASAAADEVVVHLVADAS